MRIIGFPNSMYDTGAKKRRIVGLVLLAILLTLFLVFNRVPKLDTVRADLAVATSPVAQCFQGFCIEGSPDSSLLSRWWDFSLTYLRLVSFGMIFAFLVAGTTEAFLFPKSSGWGFSATGVKGSLKGLLIGPAMNLCSACIVPVASAFRRRGSGVETTLAITQGSSTLNLPAIIMAAMVFAPLIGGARIGLSLVGALLIGPLVARVVRRDEDDIESPLPYDVPLGPDQVGWGEAIGEGFREWVKITASHVIRLAPVMILAGFASGLAIQWVSPQTVTTWLGDDILGILIAATLGIAINVPLLFEIPLVAVLLLSGMGTAPAAALLFTAAAGGPITFWGLAKVMPRKAIAAFGASTWGLGAAGGLIVLAFVSFGAGPDFGLRADYSTATQQEVTTRAAPPPVASTARTVDAETSDPGDRVKEDEVAPFTNIAPQTLGDKAFIINRYPGVAIFDYDRDGDLDFYVTQHHGAPNFLFRNDGDGAFQEVAQQAGIAAVESASMGVAACDFNNDGYQDLYVGSQGRFGDGLDFRSIDQQEGLKEAIVDRLFLNNGDGTFRDITESAFGDSVNIRSAASVACADVDGDGWLDIYVANRADVDFITFDVPQHPGNYNVLYRNTGDLTFTEMADQAGVRGSQIVMRTPDGEAIVFEDPDTGARYEGYDPTLRDFLGNRVGDPTAQAWAILFFDYDDDGDPDLLVADDGDRLKVYRNDSGPGNIKFTSVGHAMGIDKKGAWMGFALGDYDGDQDLDIFVTNVGFHPMTRKPPPIPGADCAYAAQFEWGTCGHFLLRNDGVEEVPGLGKVGMFPDVAPFTIVKPSRIMPPAALDPSNVHPVWAAPTGLAAYDFGFGATFFDYENDGDQDLYWLGSLISRGEGPGGMFYPSAGRMLRGDGKGRFEDITVEAHLLDIQDADYSILDPNDPRFDATEQRIGVEFHENGKGLAQGDLNNDGFVDLIATNSSGAVWIESGEIGLVRGPLFVWINSGGENHWITLRLRGRMAVDGTGSNADAIGARVYLKAEVALGDSLTQVQEVLGSSTLLSMNSLDLNFGLGQANRIEEITILWPSGVRQVLRGIQADQVLSVQEPKK